MATTDAHRGAEAAGREGAARGPGTPTDSGSPTPPGPFEGRDGDLYFAGTSITVPDLERARRAGSSEADLRAAFPELPAGAFDAVDALLRARPELTAAWAERLAPSPAETDDGDDDGDGFEAELEGLLDSHAELFRRLAQ
jgi:uncharacterized protein (DUF433 family)